MARSYRLDAPEPTVSGDDLPNDPEFATYPLPGEHQYVPGYSDATHGAQGTAPDSVNPTDHTTARTWRPYTGQNVHGRAWPAVQSDQLIGDPDNLADNVDRSYEATDTVEPVRVEDLVTVNVSQQGPVRSARVGSDQAMFNSYLLPASVAVNVAQYIPNRARVVITNTSTTSTVWLSRDGGVVANSPVAIAMLPSTTTELNYNGRLFVYTTDATTLVNVIQEMWNVGGEAGEIKTGW